MKPEIVIALYRPHDGKDAELRELLRRHIPTLRRLELITDRAPVLVKAKDGTYVEIFEWRSGDSASIAHQHPELARVWEAMGEVCELPVLDSLEEAKKQFPHFEPVEL